MTVETCVSLNCLFELAQHLDRYILTIGRGISTKMRISTSKSSLERICFQSHGYPLKLD